MNGISAGITPPGILGIPRFSEAVWFASLLYKRLSLKQKRAHRALYGVVGAIAVAIREAWGDPDAANERCRKARAKGKSLHLRVTRLVLGGGGRCQETCEEIHRLAGCAAYAAAPLNGDPAPKDWEDAAGYIKKRGGVRKLADLYAARCPDNGDHWRSYVARQAHSNNEWYTPAYIFALLGCEFDLDPASPGKQITPWIPVREVFTEHGLERDWFGFVWCNPPFGRGVIDQWVRKFIRHGNGIILVPDRVENPWWQELLEASDLMLAVNRRISFHNGRDQRVGQMPTGTFLVAIGPKGVEALKRASKRGLGKLMKHVAVDVPTCESIEALANGDHVKGPTTFLADPFIR